MTKYRISYKNEDGSHDSSETLTAEELIVKLLTAIEYYEGKRDDSYMTTPHFEVEKRTQLYPPEK